MYPQLKVMHIQYRQVGKPQGTQREKHIRITNLCELCENPCALCG